MIRAMDCADSGLMLRKTGFFLPGFFMLCGGITALLLGVSGYAEVYRWVDSSGVVNFTQKLPAGVSADKVTTPLAPASARRLAAKAKPQAPKQKELSPEQQQMFDSLRAKEDARQAEIGRIKASNCERAQKVVNRLSQDGRIRVKAASGEERNLPEDERARRISEAQKGVALNCVS